MPKATCPAIISLPQIQVPTQIIPDHSRSLINHVDSPDIPFEWSINPYRGCEHGCIYCYARPYHEYLGFSCGLDFETMIMAKFEAAALLRKELAKPRWKGQTIVMSAVTDCYQPIEQRLGITRSCLQVMAEFRQPVSIVTKNRLVLRDLDYLKTLSKHGAASVTLSLTTLDQDLAARMEPRASSPADRLHAITALAQAGIPVSVMVAPVIPGLTDREIPALLKAAAEAGAHSAGYTLVRLPYEVKTLFVEWLQRHFPDRAAHVEQLLRQTRGGKLYDADLRQRMKGSGPLAEHIRAVFRVFARRHGLNQKQATATKTRSESSAYDIQGSLF